jgi:hypothetical protein
MRDFERVIVVREEPGASSKELRDSRLRVPTTCSGRFLGPRLGRRSRRRLRPTVALSALLVGVLASIALAEGEGGTGAETRRLLWVANPGVRNYLEYGGHGILVFDIDDGHRLVKRIPTAGLDESGKPLNVKGVAAHAESRRYYITTLRHLIAVDIVDERVVYEKSYEKGCDRLALSNDGKTIWLPTLEADHWKVVDAASGDVVKVVTTNSGAHNTVAGQDGRFYLAGLRSSTLTVVDGSTNSVVFSAGPFSAPIRPFTVNGAGTLCFVNVNSLLGFEIGDLRSGKMLHRVVVAGFSQGPVKRHGCPSHGIGLTPDEKEIWLTDAFNERLHVFDATVLPPRQVASIRVRDQPGWITFSIDGSIAWPSTGDAISVRSRVILARLTDEEGRAVQSEKLLEIDFADGVPVRAGNQFAIGRVAENEERGDAGDEKEKE